MKAWKIAQLLGVLLLLVGVVVRVGAGEISGTYMMLAGAIVYAVGRVAAWLASDEP